METTATTDPTRTEIAIADTKANIRRTQKRLAAKAEQLSRKMMSFAKTVEWFDVDLDPGAPVYGGGCGPVHGSGATIDALAAQLATLIATLRLLEFIDQP